MTKEEIKNIMKKNNISYRKLADILEISHGYLYDMLNGRKKLQMRYTIRIKRIFKEIEYE